MSHTKWRQHHQQKYESDSSHHIDVGFLSDWLQGWYLWLVWFCWIKGFHTAVQSVVIHWPWACSCIWVQLLTWLIVCWCCKSFKAFKSPASFSHNQHWHVQSIIPECPSGPPPKSRKFTSLRRVVLEVTWNTVDELSFLVELAFFNRYRADISVHP